MKKLLAFFLLLGTLYVLSSCSPKNKTDYDSDSPDTSGYIQQPEDNTRMNDTMQIQSADTSQLHPDTNAH